MGNTSQKQNTNFNTTYNMQQHQRKMSEMNHYYHNHNLAVPNNNKFKTNKTYNNKIEIGFEYFSQNGCKLTVYASVNGIIQDDKTQKTIRIQSQYKFQQQLAPGPSSWNIILQKLQTPSHTYQIQNIYKGGSQQQQDCIVCMSQKSTTIVKPCNHMCLCKECADRVGKSTDKCPICRKAIQGLVLVKQ